jgi:hypothetical protein
MLCLAALVVFSACDNWNIPVKDRMEFYASVVPVSSWEELRAQVEESDAALLALTHDVVLDDTNLPITVGRTLTITAFEGTRTISRGPDDTTAFKFQLFEVGVGGNLTLGHPQGGTLILDGGAVWNELNQSQNDGVTAGDVLVKVENAQLTIRDGAILRNNDNTTGEGGGVHVNSSSGSAALIMTGGAISGNRAKTGNGGGVYVVNQGTGSSATLTMTGGVISGNRADGDGNDDDGGGGVYVAGTGTELTMSGGSIISENTAPRGGGVYVYSGALNGATLIMKGGSISENTASVYGGGVYVTNSDNNYSAKLTMENGSISKNTASTYGGGVYMQSNGKNSIVELAMEGGSISENTTSIEGGTYSLGGGVYMTSDDSNSSAILTMTGGAISGNKAYGSGVSGGGVYVQGGSSGSSSAILTMEGGAISGNKAHGSDAGGGGVYIWGDGGSAQLTMDNDAIISGNETVRSGGGVYLFGGNAELTMHGGTISDNKCSNDSGGGVYVTNGASFTMHDGIVSGNKAIGTFGKGGGVFLYDAAFTMNGGVVSGNTAGETGGGVQVGSGGQFIKNSGGGVIYGGTEPAHLKNTASSNSKGHAAYVTAGSKYRDTTVPEGMELKSGDTTGWNQ